MTFRELLEKLQHFAKDNPTHEALDQAVVVRFQTDEYNGDDLHAGGLRSLAMETGCTETFALILEADQEPDESDEPDDPNEPNKTTTGS